MNHNVSIGEAKDWARNFPFADVIEPGELPEILGSGASNYWLDTRSQIADGLEKISEMTSLLADDRSVATVLSLTRFRLSADIAQHPEADAKHQYLPPDLAKMIPQPIVFVDGGAFIGDTAESFLARGVKISEWYAFEPDPGNFHALIASPARDAIPRAIFFPCGLGDTLREIDFVAESTASSHVAMQPCEGMIKIKIVTLDDGLSGITPTLIKLDIEGYEAAALAGMRRTLKKNGVALAISIYHKPADLWELPMLVRELMPNAELYIRQHGFNGFDTVLYALTDRERSD
jgi:FkbM family methyltransferase